MRTKIIIIGLIMFALTIFNGNSQPYFYSQSLQNLYYSLPASCRLDTPVAETIVECSEIISDATVPVVYIWDNYEMLTHIGYRFLPDSELLQAYNPAIVRFLERELLTLLTTNNLQQKLDINRDNCMVISFNGNTPKTNFYRSRTGLPSLLQQVSGMDIRYEEDGNYKVDIKCGKEQTLTFHFVADAELLTNMDKKERDDRIAAQLSNHKAEIENLQHIPICSKAILQVHNDTLFVCKGGAFIIPQINNNLYYTETEDYLKLVFSKNWIAETFSNVMLAPAKHNYAIQITHRVYGGKMHRYELNSRDFFDYFSDGYERFCGIEKIEKDIITGTLVLADKNMSNIHLAFVSISVSDLLYGGIMKIQLDTNIPQHNIETLFGRKKEKSNENQYNINLE